MSEEEVVLDTIPVVQKAENALGVSGYARSRDVDRAHGFPSLDKKDKYITGFLNDRGIKEGDIPLRVDLSPADEEDMSDILKAGVVLALEKYNYSYEDTEGLSVVSPRGSLVAKKGGEQTHLMLEVYKEEDKTIYVANRLSYDSEMRAQLADLYNLPRDASADYSMLYLTVHSAVHHIQTTENRMSKKPVVEGDADAQKKAYLELETEKEAHNTAIEITDDIWEATVVKSKSVLFAK